MNHYSTVVEQFEAEHVRPLAGTVLIVGSKVYATRTDRRKRHPCAIGVDMQDGDGVDVVADLEGEIPYQLKSTDFSHVECMSVLEHSRRPWLMAENIQRLMPSGSTIFITAPFVWRVHAYPSDYFRFTAAGIESLFDKIKFTALMYASATLSDSPKIHSAKIDDYPYFVRTEICGFGVRK